MKEQLLNEIDYELFETNRINNSDSMEMLIDEVSDFVGSDLDKKLTISIGEMSNILNVSPRTLRLWHKNKILIPKRSIKNRRIYTKTDIDKGFLILFIVRYLTNKFAGARFIVENIDKTKSKNESYTKYINKLSKELDINTKVIMRSKRGRRKLQK